MCVRVCVCVCVPSQDFVDRKLAVSLRCGDCDPWMGGGGGGRGGQGCLKELSVTALRTTVTITYTGEPVWTHWSGQGSRLTSKYREQKTAVECNSQQREAEGQ